MSEKKKGRDFKIAALWFITKLKSKLISDYSSLINSSRYFVGIGNCGRGAGAATGSSSSIPFNTSV
jgi:hypothetical protein